MKRSQISSDLWTKYACGVIALLFLMMSVSIITADAYQSHVFQWREASPKSQGMDGAKLDAMKDALAERQTKAFLEVIPKPSVGG